MPGLGFGVQRSGHGGAKLFLSVGLQIVVFDLGIRRTLRNFWLG